MPVILKMKKLATIILIVNCYHVLGQDIGDNQDPKGKGYDGSYGQSFINPNKDGGNLLSGRTQRYPGIWVGSDRNVQGRYDNDDIYGQNGDYYSDENGGQNYNSNYDDGRYSSNRYGQGIRIGVNGYVGNNRFSDRQDRNGVRGQDLRAQLLLNAGLRNEIGLNAALRARLALNAQLRARLGLNAGLSLGTVAGLTAGAGLRVGLDLSLGAGQGQQEDLVRPCQMEDYQCIRKLFAENSQCNPSYGPAPDPLYLDQNTLFFPYANISYTLTNLKISGMANAKISDLYINRVTGNVVLSIQIKNLNETSPRAYLSYKRTGKEPIILADASSILFASLTLTVVLPRIPNLRLDLADIHAYIDDDAPEYKIGPGAYTNADPDVTAAFLQLTANLGVALREGFLLQAQLLAALFIQLNICDFGVDLISV